MAEEKSIENNENTITEDAVPQNNQNDSPVEEIETKTNNEEPKQELEEFVKKSNNPLKKILFILIGLLVTLLIIGSILYFLGFFEHKEEKKEEEIKVETQEAIIEKPKEEENYKFDIKNINSKKLNEQLASLTNKNINQEKVENEKKLLEEEKIKEEEALKLEEEKIKNEKIALEEKKLLLENEKAQLEALKQEAILMKQQLQSNNVNTDHLNVEEKIQDKKEPIKEKIQENNNKVDKEAETKNEVVNTEFLKFINVAKIKGQLYKKYLDKVTKINTNVLLCRDDKNRIELYFGPFENENERAELLNKLIKNGFEEAYEVEFTKEEFDRRCNY